MSYLKVGQAELAARDFHSPEAIRARRGPDYRLLPAALAVWVAVAWTVVTSGSALPALVAAAVAGLCGIGLSMVRLRARSILRHAMLAATCAAAIAASTWARLKWLSSNDTLREVRAGRSPTIAGEYAVAGTPKQAAEGAVILPVDIPQLGSVPMYISAERVYGASDTAPEVIALQPGERIILAARATFDDSPGMVPLRLMASRGVEWAEQPEPQGIWAITAWLRGGLRWAVSGLEGDIAGLIPGMVVGDVSGQSPDATHAFHVTGLSHLTAVSGSNVAIVVSVAMVLLSALGVSRQWKILGCAVSLLGFVAVVGPEPSVLRAAVMGSVGIVAVATARWADVLAALGAAIIGLLIVDPGLAVAYGFVLSVVATTGIVVGTPRLSRSMLRWWMHRSDQWWGKVPSVAEAELARLLSVTIVADVVTAPVLVHMTGMVSVTGILANLLVSACVPVVTVLGLAAAPVGGLLSVVGAPSWVAWPVLGPAVPSAWWIVKVAEGLSRVPRFVTPGGWLSSLLWAGLLALALGSFYASRQQIHVLRWAWLGAAVLLALTLRIERLPGESAWDAPENIDVSGKRVHTVPEDADALRLNGLDPRQDLVVITSCGRSHGRPTVTREGVPVVYPCRDGTELVGVQQ